jgi:long-subunit fatty acid transport protein
MIKVFRIILLVACIAGSVTAFGQVTTGSPYSQYGLGSLKDGYLPQYKAMGGIGVGISSVGSVYNNINPLNPATYGGIRTTVFDVGAAGSYFELSKGSLSDKSFNGTLSHLLFAVPVNKISAFSFGLTPYTELGYNFKSSSKLDTNNVDYLYNGDGGLSRAYFGYGILVGKHISAGFNAGYIFGRLDKSSSTQFPNDASALSTRSESSNNISGLNFDLGLQYKANLSPKMKLSFGYVLTTGNKLGSREDMIVTHYRVDINQNESAATDTLNFTQGARVTIKLPVTNAIGFALERSDKWLIGADFSTTSWSDFRVGNTNPNLSNSYRVAVGGQITPDVRSVSNYFKLIDYRLGFKYDKTYINVNNTDINQKAVTFGFGLPLLANRTAFYKINLSAELGQRGTLDNNLVRERFVNFNLGFLLNDKWFYKNKLD